jgi:hypothetical protein
MGSKYNQLYLNGWPNGIPNPWAPIPLIRGPFCLLTVSKTQPEYERQPNNKINKVNTQQVNKCL